MRGSDSMNDLTLLGPWVRRFLLEHLVAERNLARNTQRSYRDALTLLIPFEVLTGLHTLIACQQQRLRLGVFFLSGKAATQQALGAKSLPVVRLCFQIELHGLACERLAFGELALRQLG